MTRIILIIICLFASLMLAACGSGSKLAINIIDDTKAQIIAAEQASAKQTAVNELRDAANLLNEAEAALDRGDNEEAYRIGTKAYLIARYTEAVAKKRKAELTAKVAESELKEAQEAEKEALREREQSEAELNVLESQ